MRRPENGGLKTGDRSIIIITLVPRATLRGVADLYEIGRARQAKSSWDALKTVGLKQEIADGGSPFFAHLTVTSRRLQ